MCDSMPKKYILYSSPRKECEYVDVNKRKKHLLYMHVIIAFQSCDNIKAWMFSLIIDHFQRRSISLRFFLNNRLPTFTKYFAIP